MTMIVLIGLLAMCLIITLLELDKVKARLFDENRALEDKAFNVVRQYELECD